MKRQASPRSFNPETAEGLSLNQARAHHQEEEGGQGPHELVLLFSRSAVSYSLRPRELLPTRLLGPWNSPGKNTGMGCHFLLQVILPTPGSTPHLLH